MPDELVAKIKALPVHPISGYEWECAECHYHFAQWDEICDVCERPIENSSDGEYVDHRGRPCDHDRLVSLDEVLELLR